MKRITGIMMSLAVMLAVHAAPAQAGNITLPATYTVISQQQTASGTTALTIDLIITNPAASALSSLTFYPLDLQLIMPMDAAPMQVMSIGTGGSLTVNLNLESMGPFPAPDRLLVFRGSALDGNGQPVGVLIVGEGR